MEKEDKSEKILEMLEEIKNNLSKIIKMNNDLQYVVDNNNEFIKKIFDRFPEKNK